MNWPFTKDRRKAEERRERERRVAARGEQDRRGQERRGDERREDVRLYYPPTDTLNISQSDPAYISQKFRVLDMISAKALRLICVADCMDCQMPVKAGEKINATIEFHDGTKLNTKGKVLRYNGDTKMRKNIMIYLLDDTVPQNVISSEQRYLLQHYPEFLAALSSN